MKTIKNILGVFTLAMILIIPSGCTKESLFDEPIKPEGTVRLKINTDNGGFQAPSTRATANENNIDDLWVLVFKGSDYSATFVEAVKSTGTESKRYVVLTEATGNHTLLVVANADTFINAKKALLTANITTLTAAISILQYGNPYNATAGDGTLANPQIAMPFADPVKSIPMSEVLSVSGISSATEINATGTVGGSALELRRITAKVVVDGSAVFSKLKITRVAAYQGARNSTSLVPGDNDVTQTGGTFINYHKGSAFSPREICPSSNPTTVAKNNTENFPVYVYESTGTSNFIIIKATLNGVACYYKLRLAKEDGTDYEIKRNYKYIFNITLVPDGVTYGYLSLKAAIAGTESNIVGKITEIKDSTPTDILDNGSYYLGCSNSEFLVYANGEKSNLTALTITTNATTAMNDGRNSITADGRGLTVSPATINLNAGGAAQGTETNVTVTLMESFTAGTITLKLGNLVKKITVQREPMLSFEATSKEFATDYVSGKVTAGGEWLSLGIANNPAQGSAQVTRPDQQGSVYLFTKGNYSTIAGTVRTGGEAYLARHNTQGRVKIYAEQDVRNPFPAYPGVIGYDPVRGDLNIEGRGVMVYFKYGGIIAMYARFRDDSWSSDDVAFNPTDITIGDYNSFPTPIRNDGGTVDNINIDQSFHRNVINARNGNGDPCSFIKPDGSGMTAAEVRAALANNTVPDQAYWRLPTKDQNSKFITANSTSTKVAATAAGDPTLWQGRSFTALEGFKYGNFLPSAGERLRALGGKTLNHGWCGTYWSSTPSTQDKQAYSLTVLDPFSNSSASTSQADGYSVRCVRAVPPSYPAYPGVIGYDPVRDDLNLEGRGVMVYFKYGGIIAMHAGRMGDQWNTDGSLIAFNPTNISVSSYNSFPTPLRSDGGTAGNFPIDEIFHRNVINARNGNGDPCRFIKENGSGMTANEVRAALASGTDVPDQGYWRLPTDAQNSEFTTIKSTWERKQSIDDWKYYFGRAFSELISIYGNHLPAAGFRLTGTGEVSTHGPTGHYWSSTPHNATDGLYLSFDINGSYPSHSGSQSFGFAVRCVRQP